MKQLTEMSDEELGTLFPIILTEHKKDWAKFIRSGRKNTLRYYWQKHLPH